MAVDAALIHDELVREPCLLGLFRQTIIAWADWKRAARSSRRVLASVVGEDGLSRNGRVRILDPDRLLQGRRAGRRRGQVGIGRLPLAEERVVGPGQRG